MRAVATSIPSCPILSSVSSLTSPAAPARPRQRAEELPILGHHAHALLVVHRPVQLLQLHPLRGGGAASPQPRDGHRGGQQRSPGRPRPRPSSSIAGGSALRRFPLVLRHAGTAPGNGPGTQVPKRLAVQGAAAAAAGGPAAGEGGGHHVAVAVGVLVVGAGGGAGDQRADQAVAASQGPLAAVVRRVP